MDATTGSVSQVSSNGSSSAAETRTSPQTTQMSPVGAALLCQAHSLLERLWGSREMKLYIGSDGRYGGEVHSWLTRYSEVQLGRGFARQSHGDVFAELETAADGLIDCLLTHGDQGSACTLCHRGTVGGVLGHAESCAAGKLYGAIATVREELVGFDERTTEPDRLPGGVIYVDGHEPTSGFDLAIDPVQPIESEEAE